MARSASPSTPLVAPGRRIQTRRSGVHGKGVFAVQDIAEGEVLVEYTGEVVGWQEAQDRHPHDPLQPNHTFYFHVDEDHVIDAKFGGNSSRWINHSCNPNCYADEQDHRIFITALRNIKAGEELNYDYGLIIEERYTKKLKAEYPCWCGSKNCRGTLLAPKRGWAPPVPLPPSQLAAKLKKSAKAVEAPKAKKKAATQPQKKDTVKAKTQTKTSAKAAAKPVQKSRTVKASDKKSTKTSQPATKPGRSQ